MMNCLCRGCNNKSYDITYNPIARMKLPVAKREMLGYFCKECIDKECGSEHKEEKPYIPRQRTA